MRLLLIFGFTLLSSPLAAKDCVVLVHGLARSEASMRVFGFALDQLDYQTIRVDYPSTDHSIATLAASTIPPGIAKCEPDATIHFVTHSMGAILLRHYLSGERPEKLGHTVMLGPPNKGSEVVDQFKSMSVFDWINGPAGNELGTSKNSTPNILPSADYSVGVLAGSQSLSPLFSVVIPGPDDGKVSAESTKLDGMTDHIILPVTHTFMMNNPAVIHQVLTFLENGSFDHSPQGRDMTWLGLEQSRGVVFGN